MKTRASTAAKGPFKPFRYKVPRRLKKNGEIWSGMAGGQTLCYEACKQDSFAEASEIL